MMMLSRINFSTISFARKFHLNNFLSTSLKSWIISFLHFNLIFFLSLLVLFFFSPKQNNLKSLYFTKSIQHSHLFLNSSALEKQMNKLIKFFHFLFTLLRFMRPTTFNLIFVDCFQISLIFMTYFSLII